MENSDYSCGSLWNQNRTTSVMVMDVELGNHLNLNPSLIPAANVRSLPVFRSVAMRLPASINWESVWPKSFDPTDDDSFSHLCPTMRPPTSLISFATMQQRGGHGLGATALHFR
ncbi:hypothetical protein SASPL_110648 [Salvia splendens]|uniref:Uncharacterized protein n=1 Tax=Salvia splendens TaxID=180675 RepID=A0A8X8YAD2_SALSN|nr:hypothetical protein SASPL_110648 [Salvia splendens]